MLNIIEAEDGINLFTEDNMFLLTEDSTPPSDSDYYCAITGLSGFVGGDIGVG